MKYMIHMTGESTTTIEEVLIFGGSVEEIRQGEDYKDFQSDGYTEEASFEVEAISGHELLPSYIMRA